MSEGILGMSYNTRTLIEEPVIRKFAYGSVVYGTAGINSDLDYIYVVESDEEFDYNVKNYENIDVIVYSKPTFIKHIKDHRIFALESIFQDEENPFRQYFKLDTEKLRREVSSVSSNSFVKCKKKFKDGEYYIGKKSLFHSLRILNYGIQIAKFGFIADYSCANQTYRNIMAMESTDWEDYKAIYQPIFNSLKSTFKLLAPLEVEKL
jgi:hypothetical protein